MRKLLASLALVFAAFTSVVVAATPAQALEVCQTNDDGNNVVTRWARAGCQNVQYGFGDSWGPAFILARSPDGLNTLQYQSDGNLVHYGPGGVYWSSNTWGQYYTHLVLQTDGNMVIYRSNGSVVWASNSQNRCTAAQKLYELRIQYDARAKEYCPNAVVWQNF